MFVARVQLWALRGDVPDCLGKAVIWRIRCFLQSRLRHASTGRVVQIPATTPGLLPVEATMKLSQTLGQAHLSDSLRQSFAWCSVDFQRIPTCLQHPGSPRSGHSWENLDYDILGVLLPAHGCLMGPS